jgi:hypothetical protein
VWCSDLSEENGHDPFVDFAYTEPDFEVAKVSHAMNAYIFIYLLRIYTYMRVYIYRATDW